MALDVRWTAGETGTGHPHRAAVRTSHVPFRRIQMSEDTEQPGPDPAAGTPEHARRRPPADGPGSAGGAVLRRDADVLGTGQRRHEPEQRGAPAHRRHAATPAAFAPADRRLVLPAAAARRVGAADRHRHRTGDAGHPDAVPFSYPPSGGATSPGPARRDRTPPPGKLAGLAARGHRGRPHRWRHRCRRHRPGATTTTAATDQRHHPREQRGARRRRPQRQRHHPRAREQGHPLRRLHRREVGATRTRAPG